jgi:FlaA1/EpsC-like NDP-sugar epimerase
VLDPNCFVVQLFNRQIANGGPVTITHPESVRYFMNTKEACQLILEAAAMEGGLHIRYG